MFPSSPLKGWRSSRTYGKEATALEDADKTLRSLSFKQTIFSPPKSPDLTDGTTWNVATYVRVMPDIKDTKVLVEYAYQNAQESNPDEEYRAILELKIPDELATSTTFASVNDSGILKYEFSKVFDADATQSTVFDVVAKDKILGAFDGINSTVFAFGQTGSGKTYTVFGGDSFQERGLIPRSIACLFKEYRAKKNLNFSVRCRVSFTEVYKETVYDLLDKNKVVKVFEGEHGVILRNVNVFDVDSEDDALALFFSGVSNRKTTHTIANDKSSRSHAIFTLIVECKGPRLDGKTVFTSGKISLVDLAGSARNNAVSSPSKEVIEEIKTINIGLHQLENVMVSLRKRKQSMGSSIASTSSPNGGHVPYRNSMLTNVLRDSLGGNCRSAFILNISSERLSFEETVSTCRFGQKIINNGLSKNLSPRSTDDIHRSEELTDKMQLEKLQKKVDLIGKRHRDEILAIQKQMDEAKEQSNAVIVVRDRRIAELERLLLYEQKQQKVKPPSSPSKKDQPLVVVEEERSPDMNNKQKSSSSAAATSSDVQKQQQQQLQQQQEQQIDTLTEQLSQLQQQRMNDEKRATELETKLNDMKQRNTTLAEATKFDQQMIVSLRKQLNELQTKQDKNDATDTQRLNDVKEVNELLLNFHRDSQFQSDLSRPLVKVALECWGGQTISHIPEAQLEAARFDEGVIRIYPR